MDILLFVPAVILALFSIAILSNKLRSYRLRNLTFELEANCLLTRWPLLFISGPRSFFYFESYWNIYTPYLAEHGYEVFKLNLPWNRPDLRKRYFTNFIQEQAKRGFKFHLVMDTSTLNELTEILKYQSYTSIVSLTAISDADATLSENALAYPTKKIKCLKSKSDGILVLTSFALHKKILKKYYAIPSLSTLGACHKTALQNGRLLLEHAQSLAENDFINN